MIPLILVVVLIACHLVTPFTLNKSRFSQLPLRETTSEEIQRDRRQWSRDVGTNPLLSLNLNLDALARSEASERAQELYQRIAALHREGYYSVSPDVVSFNSVLKAWKSDPARALEFWEEEVGKLSKPNRPNIRSYNTFMLSLANVGMHESAVMLLRQMQTPISAVVPDRITHNTVLLSFLMSNDDNVAELADSMLQEMHDSTYMEPDLVSFNSVIAVWAKHSDASKSLRRIEELLSELKDHDVLKPDVYSYTSTIQAYARKATSKHRLHLSSRLKHLLDEMEEMGLYANKVTHTIALQALCNSGELVEAQSMLSTLLKKGLKNPSVRPDCVTFSVVLDGLAKHARVDADFSFQASQDVFELMKSTALQHLDCIPNEQTYTSVLACIARSKRQDAGTLAHKQLLEMQRSPHLTPCVIHYNSVLDAVAKASFLGKAETAWRILSSMEVNGIEPDTITFNTVLAAAANSFGPPEAKQQALEIGSKTFQMLMNDPSCEPTSLSYHYWFKTLKRLCPDSKNRQNLALSALRSCCDHGCLNDQLLAYVTGTLIPVSRLPDSLQGTKIPSKWSSNAMKVKRLVKTKKSTSIVD